jgi:pimeloyl-ACP methyl ester carboxylesterase
MDRTEQHATGLDGTRIWWSSAGAGRPAAVLMDGIGCAGYVWRPLEAELARERRVIHFNYRGHGRSGPPADPERMTVEDAVQDLQCVVDAARERKVVLVGHSMGVQIALEAYRRRPGRVAALVLLFGAPGRLLDTFHGSDVVYRLFPWGRDLVLRWPDVARRLLQAVVPTDLALRYALRFEVDGARVEPADIVRYLEDLSRVEPAHFVRMLDSAANHDASAVLPHVAVPTLVVAGERDTFTPLRLSEAMAHAIPGAELLVVRGGTHVGPLEQPELVNGRVREFLARHAPVRTPRRAAARPATAPRRPRAARSPRARSTPRRTDR